MARTLVSGGAGFIGSHLVEALVERGDEVRVLDNFSTGRPENLVAVTQRIELIEGDVRDEDVVRAAMRDVEQVFHLAALVSVPLSVEDPITTHAVNVDGTLNILVAAREAGVRSLVYASSSAVYGDLPDLPKVETLPVAPTSPYGLSKQICEQYARLFARLYGLRTVGLRYFNVYGPRQDPGSPYSGVISIFVDHLLASIPPTIYGDGRQTRDFVYVTDVVRASLLAADTPAAAGQVFNISTNRPHTILDLWEMLQTLTGTHLSPCFAAERPGDICHSYASYELARRVLGFEPQIGLMDGLRRTVAWCRSQT